MGCTWVRGVGCTWVRGEGCGVYMGEGVLLPELFPTQCRKQCESGLRVELLAGQTSLGETV